MPQEVRAVPASRGPRISRTIALLSAGALVATLTGIVVGTRPESGPPTGSAPGSRTQLSSSVTTPSAAAAQAAHAAQASPSVPAAGPAPAARRASTPTSAATAPANSRAGKRPAAQPTITEHGVRFVHACSQDVAPGQVACYAERRTDLPSGLDDLTTGAAAPTGAAAAGSRALVSSGPAGLHPQDLQDAYDLPSTTAGTGQTVYIVDAFDDPTAESDLAVYRQQFGLPACTTANGCFTKLNQKGQTAPLPVANAGWSQEITLDVDMVSAICPNCHITLIEAADDRTGVFTAVAEANTLGAKFVSMSWGGSEPTTARSLAAMDATFAATGVVYTAASGDDGYANGVIYPATSNRVIAVGGTALAPAAGTTRGWTESAWVKAGSGCSTIAAPASWQVNSTPCSRRATTDVSAVADPATGVSVYQGYGGRGWDVYGGTSAATPIIASVYALVGTPAPALNPAELLYQHPHSLYDITSGSNGSCSISSLCHGVAGWDGPTGLGTPHGLGAFQPARSAHSTSPGSTVAPGWPASKTP